MRKVNCFECGNLTEEDDKRYIENKGYSCEKCFDKHTYI